VFASISGTPENEAEGGKSCDEERKAAAEDEGESDFPKDRPTDKFTHKQDTTKDDKSTPS
jgi:hypothetical protein